MPWSPRFLQAFLLAASGTDFTLDCESRPEARRRQLQFHAFRRQYRLRSKDKATANELNRVVVSVEGDLLILRSKERLREKLEAELEAKLNGRTK